MGILRATRKQRAACVNRQTLHGPIVADDRAHRSPHLVVPDLYLSVLTTTEEHALGWVEHQRTHLFACTVALSRW